MLFNELLGKKVAFFGLGREGSSFINLWKTRAPQVQLTILDEHPTLESEQLANNNGFNYIKGDAVSVALKDFDIIVRSSGISRYRDDIIQATSSGTVFTSIIDLWFSENNNRNLITVTGTKGKSTTSSLITHLLNFFGTKTTLAGNIGIPLFLDPLQDLTSTSWVIELSSYQASEIKTSIPLAVLLNLYPEHCDWHGSVERYYLDKLNIFKHQSAEDFAIINGNDSKIKDYSDYLKNKIYFNTPSSIHIQDGSIFNGSEKLFSYQDFSLSGPHNATNICAALTVLNILGYDLKLAEEGIRTFLPLSHRMQYVGESNGITFIDDSISTIPQATLAALETFSNHKTTVIMGGQKRAQDWNFFAQELKKRKNKPLAIITIPDNGFEIIKALKTLELHEISLHEADDLKTAVDKAKEITPQGGLVLLSPAAPSYGHFKNFEERGDAFKKYSLT